MKCYNKKASFCSDVYPYTDKDPITLYVRIFELFSPWQFNSLLQRGCTFVDLGGGGIRGLHPLLSNFKMKESNKTKQKIEYNPLEKEEERKSCMFV